MVKLSNIDQKSVSLTLSFGNDKSISTQWEVDEVGVDEEMTTKTAYVTTPAYA